MRCEPCRRHPCAWMLPYPIFNAFSAFFVTNAEKLAEMAAKFWKVICY